MSPCLNDGTWKIKKYYEQHKGFTALFYLSKSYPSFLIDQFIQVWGDFVFALDFDWAICLLSLSNILCLQSLLMVTVLLWNYSYSKVNLIVSLLDAQSISKEI